MYTYTTHRHLVPFHGELRLTQAPTVPTDTRGKKEEEAALQDAVKDIADLQERLYAEDARALWIVFQGMDGAGKDSAIRKLLTGVNPAGVRVSSFKRPSSTELNHDFLWRTTAQLPQRGMIGVFNRSHYEEVLVLRVRPNFLGASLGRSRPIDDEVWPRRYQAIRAHEQHLADEGTVILKFFLHLSKEEQRDRLLARIDTPTKNWKFNAGDLDERALWPRYQEVYEAALRETSRAWAPWYAIPADNKPYARRVIAEIVRDTLVRMAPRYPEVSDTDRAELTRLRAQLAAE